MLVIWLKMVHSEVTEKIRSAGFDVFICAVMTVAVVFGACTLLLPAVAVILLAGRLLAAPAPERRSSSNVALASTTAASNTIIGDRRVSAVGFIRLLSRAIRFHAAAGAARAQDVACADPSSPAPQAAAYFYSPATAPASPGA